MAMPALSLAAREVTPPALATFAQLVTAHRAGTGLLQTSEYAQVVGGPEVMGLQLDRLIKAVRDTTQEGRRPVLRVAAEAWQAFTSGIK